MTRRWKSTREWAHGLLLRLLRQPRWRRSASVVAGLLVSCFFLASAWVELGNGQKAVGTGYLVMATVLGPATAALGWWLSQR